MSIFQAVVLGTIQGITEFFPISSSGHLVLFQELFRMNEPQMAFDIFLHLGTLVSIIIFFWKDILNLLTKERRLLLLLAVASVPTFIIGYFFKDSVEEYFGMPSIVGNMLILTGVWLLASSAWEAHMKKCGKPAKEPGIWNSIVIGIAQGIAILPGISRSGATIATGILAGIDKEKAFRFSFLLAIPATLGAIAVKSIKIGVSITSADGLYFIVGGVTAMIVGNITIRALLKIIKNNRLYVFGLYCLLVGTLIKFLLF